MRVREFLGLDEERYQRGFQTTEDLFQWCSKIKFARPPTGCEERGRPFYDSFLLWASSHAWDPRTSVSKRKVLKLAAKTFGVEDQVSLLEERNRKLTVITLTVSEIRDSQEQGKPSQQDIRRKKASGQNWRDGSN